MFYAITTHLNIERDPLLSMTAGELVAKAAYAGDMLTESRAQGIIDAAKEHKEREAEEDQKPDAFARFRK